ncbi:XRE family transcriptional regulator [Paenibacillus polymyxa]|uniref:helix-turn-helix domain-containing protein n=1 Tax=Paenibacillus polymyxa TaxID=1406 RepID=UPI000F862683|nr:helix-turn-helix transcriptional regulator [Paenibacillus polymyxa]RTZ37886.1 XRE family transcriptional regulator [Paenibacillus polymyxa]
MNITPTIRAELEQYLKQEGLTLSQFGQIAGMNRGMVSAIVTGNKSMSINQLDLITEAMGLPEGHFYDLFIENFIIDHPPNMRRIEPFLYRCAELDKLDAIRRVVGAIMDNLLYSPKLFDIAEELLSQERLEAALILYEGVAETERYQHSERLAICQYRLFTIRVGDDQEKSYDAAVQFEPHIERLDEIDQLDALRALVNIYRSLRKWTKMDTFATALGNKAEIQYRIDLQRTKSEQTKKPFYPPFVYWAFSHLIRAEVCDANKDYETALQHIQKYADLSWVEEKDETTLKWKNQFREWANANTYVNRLLAGEINVLLDYVNFISLRKDELLPALDIIVEAANRYHFDVDDILKQFEVEISSYLEKQKIESFYTQRFVTERYMHFSKELAVYYLTKGRFSDGFNFLLSCLAKSTLINNKSYIIKCVKLYESYKEYASSETRVLYEKLIKEVEEDEA